jgi:hypothetical protein
MFNTKEENTPAAIAVCLDEKRPLLTQTKTGGALTDAGFEQVASTLTPEELVPVVKASAEGMAAADRVTFLQGTISRTPAAAAELTPLLEEAVAAKATELEKEVADAAKRAAADAATRAALERVLELSKKDLQNQIDAIKRQWEALGQKLSDLPAHAPEPAAVAPPPAAAHPTAKATGGVEPKTDEDKDFRRSEADRLAAVWATAWDAKKDEARDYLESAMWNITGLRLVGEAGARVTFDGRYHVCETPAFTGDSVVVRRPGWLLQESNDRDYVALKAMVEKA